MMNKAKGHDRRGLFQNSSISCANVIAYSNANKPAEVRQYKAENEWYRQV